jgi:kinesin family protein C1
MRGIIPRAMQQVGMYKNELEAKGWEYHMEVSFVEIYNEEIKDLLRSGPHEGGRHEIKKDQQGKIFISDVNMISVDPNDVNHIERCST